MNSRFRESYLMVWNVRNSLLDFGPFSVVSPFPGTLLCQLLPVFCSFVLCCVVFYDSDMRVDFTVNVVVGCID